MMVKNQAGKRCRVYTSRMAVSRDDFASVLRLRRDYFGEGVIVSDETYWACWQREPDSMKLVCDDRGEAVGYWSMFSVRDSVYRRFLTGELTHDDMLMDHVVRWDEVLDEAAYLYIVAAVVPSLKLYVSGRVLLDMLSFSVDVMNYLNVQGIFGYPTRAAGKKALMHLGFTSNGSFVQNDLGQPILYIPDDMEHRMMMRKNLHDVVTIQARRIPVWDAADQQRFMTRLSSVVTTEIPTNEALVHW